MKKKQNFLTPKKLLPMTIFSTFRQTVELVLDTTLKGKCLNSLYRSITQKEDWHIVIIFGFDRAWTSYKVENRPTRLNTDLLLDWRSLACHGLFQGCTGHWFCRISGRPNIRLFQKPDIRCGRISGYLTGKIKSDLSRRFWFPLHVLFLPTVSPLTFASISIALFLPFNFSFHLSAPSLLLTFSFLSLNIAPFYFLPIHWNYPELSHFRPPPHDLGQIGSYEFNWGHKRRAGPMRMAKATEGRLRSYDSAKVIRVEMRSIVTG